ncbi:ATP-dependent RNA helicase SUPV3L1, mitochondrial isoform X2 [Petromyzon marinus]|uniref:ATP-dependent RNA helicase SUPV3L1, mitochondrial n=1 Tax=Petromyzon marinus TaxID=7757 RepID=A0AAJ7WS59_PETMA|nr:ATP-dependent RNA helicase SUPV3L1, mitochondrial isoform X2 [Petromyzon marinus]
MYAYQAVFGHPGCGWGEGVLAGLARAGMSRVSHVRSVPLTRLAPHLTHQARYSPHSPGSAPPRSLSVAALRAPPCGSNMSVVRRGSAGLLLLRAGVWSRRVVASSASPRGPAWLVPSAVAWGRCLPSAFSSGPRPADTSLFVPLVVQPAVGSEEDIGAELTQSLDKNEVLKILNKFYKRKEMQKLGVDNGLDARLFHQAFISFRKWVMESNALPVEFHIALSDISYGAGHVDDIFPYFLQHSRQIFPMLECMEELRKISDLRFPSNWYPEARSMQRKIVFHAGPTNSGKTHHAIQRFLAARSAVYCGPLRLLAHEIYERSKGAGVPCDLVTGEERLFASEEGRPSSHVACTIEMCSTNIMYEVAVVDEIQMIRDPGRGWAWTRALLGLCAEEVHVCGEPAAIALVRDLMFTTGEEVEVHTYERLTPISIEDHALESLDKLQSGDCVVCFNKNDIYSISRQIEASGQECAVIYGSLPPGTKLAQAKKFNDPSDPCKILVATDAIGMGLNLSIRRVIFNSLTKPTMNEKGEKSMERISTSQALQIGGRAGRFGSAFSQGLVTTMHRDDLPVLKAIMARPLEPIQEAGLHPTAEQVELFTYNLPQATLSNIIDIFVSLSQVDGLYFVCNVDDFKFLADMIQHIPLNLRVRYVFCTAPINRKQPFVCTSFLKFARQYSRNEPLTVGWLCRHVSWPLAEPRNIRDLVHLEAVHDVFDLYLWLSYRFMDMFPDALLVRDLQRQLDSAIQEGVRNITRLIRATEESRGGVPHKQGSGEDDSSSADSPNRPTQTQGPDRTSGTGYRRKGQGTKNQGPGGAADMRIGNTTLKAVKGGSLSEQLLQQGLLTQQMLNQLRRELARDKKSRGNAEGDDGDGDKPGHRGNSPGDAKGSRG